jgi:hypothetical protein
VGYLGLFIIYLWIINYWDFAIFIVYPALSCLSTENQQPEIKNRSSQHQPKSTRPILFSMCQV